MNKCAYIQVILAIEEAKQLWTGCKIYLPKHIHTYVYKHISI